MFNCEVCLTSRVGPDIQPDTGYWNYQDGYPVLSDIQPYFTEVIRLEIRQFSLLYQTKFILSGRLSSQTGYPAQPYSQAQFLIHPGKIYEFMSLSHIKVATNCFQTSDIKIIQSSFVTKILLKSGTNYWNNLL